MSERKVVSLAIDATEAEQGMRRYGAAVRSGIAPSEAMAAAEAKAQAALDKLARQAIAAGPALDKLAQAEAKASVARERSASSYNSVSRAQEEQRKSLQAVGDAFQASAKFAVEHPIIVAAGAAVSARALSGMASSAGTSLAAAAAASGRFANENVAMGGKVAAAAGVASRGLGAASAAATATAGGLATFADRASSLTTVTTGLSRALGVVAPLLGPIALGFLAFKLGSDAMEKARADLDRLIETGKAAEKLDLSAPFLNSFTGLGARVRAETAEMQAALKQASAFVQEAFGGDRLAKLVADITAATGGGRLQAAQRIELAQGTEERLRAALAAMRELEERGQRLAAIDLGEKVFGAGFVERVRRGETSFAQIADDLAELRGREILKQEDVTRALALSREIEDVKEEIGKAVSVTFDFSKAAMLLDDAWLIVLKRVRDVAVAVDESIRPGDAAIMRRIQALQAQANQVESVSIPMQLERGNFDAVDNLRTFVAGLRAEVDRLSPSLRNAEVAIDDAVGRVPPALPVMSDELATMRAAAEQAARGLDATGASAAQAGAQLGAAAVKARGFAEALASIQAANPNLSSTISLMGRITDVSRTAAEGAKSVLADFDAGKIGDGEAQQRLKALNDSAAESIKALRTEAEKPFTSYIREAEIGGLKDLDQTLARSGDRYADVRKKAEDFYRVQIEAAKPEARGALEKERADALGQLDAAFKKVQSTERTSAAEKGASAAASEAGKAAKEAAREFDSFKDKAAEAFAAVNPAGALRKQGQDLQAELNKFRDQLTRLDPEYVKAIETKISLNLDGRELENVKHKTLDLAKEMSGAFRGVFDDMFSAGNKGFEGLLNNFATGMSRIGTRVIGTAGGFDFEDEDEMEQAA